MDKVLMEEQLRFKKRRITLHQQTIIEFAYAIRMLVEPLAESNSKLCFEEANCLTSLFNCVRRLLKSVDQDYLNQHSDVVKFYQEKRELDNSWDRLNWIVKEDTRERKRRGKPETEIVTHSKPEDA